MWAQRNGRTFSQVLVVLTLALAILFGALFAPHDRHSLLTLAGAALLLTALVHNQHRLRYRLGARRRGHDLWSWVGAHGGEVDLTRQLVQEAPFDVGRVLWRVGINRSEVPVTDIVRGQDGSFAFVAEHSAIEQFVVIPAPYVPTVLVDESSHADLSCRRISGHLVQTDDPDFAGSVMDAEALAHIEVAGLGAITFCDGFLISRSPRFVDGQTLEDRVVALRHLLRSVPARGMAANREEELLTRLRADSLAPVSWG